MWRGFACSFFCLLGVSLFFLARRKEFLICVLFKKVRVYIYLKHFWKVAVEHCVLLGAGEREGLIKQWEKVLSISMLSFDVGPLMGDFKDTWRCNVTLEMTKQSQTAPKDGDDYKDNFNMWKPLFTKVTNPIINWPANSGSWAYLELCPCCFGDWVWSGGTYIPRLVTLLHPGQLVGIL